MTRVLCFLSLLLVALTVQAETLTGRVVGVHDGDTLTLLVAGNRQVKVRLAGIDAPELAQPFGQKSKQSLSKLAFNQPATVAVSKIDDYGRGFEVGNGGRGRNRQVFAHGMAVFQPAPEGFLLGFRERGQQFVNARADEVEGNGVILARLFDKLIYLRISNSTDKPTIGVIPGIT
ncbi:MAG: thermonuclease family protein [Candidatus Contendobacter sp.]